MSLNVFNSTIAMKLIGKDTRKEIDTRVEGIRQRLADNSLDAMLVSSNANIYYTTLRFFRGYVYIPAVGKPLWFLIKPDTFEKEDDIVTVRKPENIPDCLKSLGLPLPGTIGLEFDSMSYSDIERLKAVFPEAVAANGSRILSNARMVKTEWEIQKMREDGIRHAEAYRRVSGCFKEGMTDIQFQIEIERILRLEGCLGLVRTSGNLMDINLGSVIAGDNADTPSPYDFTMGGAGADPSLPGGADGTTLKPGHTVMVDMCGSFNGYQTDMTRVWKIGEVPEIAYKAHKCSTDILRACETMAKPGVAVADLYLMAIETASRNGLAHLFMGHRQQASFIGHGIGIELNEPPVVMARSKDRLLENMTIALEPKFVIPGIGAVGVENTYVVTPSGLKPLTIFPEEIQEL